jgi:DNA polymerase
MNNTDIFGVAVAARQKLEGLKRAGVRHQRRPPRRLAATPEATEATTPRTTNPPPAVAAIAMAEPTDRSHHLRTIAGEVAACTRCAELARCRKQTVFGAGNPSAELCFVGEAPGADEDAQGEPFVGAAGQLLTRIIAAMGLERNQVYICNVLKCRPPGNRTPLPDEVANCRGFLERQLATVQPKFICALGAVAARTLLATEQSVGKMRGRFHDYRGTPLLVTYHPAYLLRNPDAKKDVWADIQILMNQMGLKTAEPR